MIGVTIIGGGIATGQLPMNLALSGQTFTGTVSAVGAQGITVYPRAVSTAAGEMPSIAVKIDQAQLSDVCLSTVARGLPLLGDVTLFARVPGDSTTAESLILDVASVGGSLTVADVRLGLDASALGEVTGSQTSAVQVGESWASTTTIDIISLTAAGASLQGLAVTVEGREASC
ncbi:MAG: DUF6230 family protein [Rhodococcus sp. (in: high G+C Gram-positive bacteria)]|jgi:hypothetical protein|uniref:DUF6230 family protein n=1 Tax=Rhodococcus sp. EPR-157 TaxID=1813677 RepID=UPI0007BBE0BD|nr:DUF6230 family protein [Rhodococcus sp. EPR-157]KZF12578.1 hypothetical protein A2J03_17020 [Rhodococcus sp. EPR-157]